MDEKRIMEEKRDLVRGAIEHRATWMALMYLEAKKEGCDAEKITRAAIRQTGLIQGANVKKSLENSEDITQFQKEFLSPIVSEVFAIDFKEVEPENLKIEFNYCALVEGWKKLDLDDETIALLCDMAMDGDRAIAEAMGYEFDLGDTIAEKCDTCNIKFYK